MKTLQLLKKLESYPVFTENDVSKVVNKGQKYVRTLMYRLHKRGLVKRIEKGKYTVHEDPLIFASHLAVPAYFSLWTALRYYNVTLQQPFATFVMVRRPKDSIVFGGGKIMFGVTKHVFGYKKKRYSDFDIFMAELEKAIIDSLLHKLPLADIRIALRDGRINFQRLASYAKRTGNASLVKRLGYLVELQEGKPYGLNALDNNYVLLDYHGRKSVKKDKKWKLLINASP